MADLAAIVPVVNEEASIAEVVAGLLDGGACCVFVVDGGSIDRTAERAAAAGAVVITELRRGYGRACLTGAEVAQASHPHELIAFADGDGSCDPRELNLLAAHAHHADVVLGNRSSKAVERGAYPWHARIGNLLAATLIGLRTGRPVHDLAPFKVLRADALARLQLRQQGYAWTTELVARAVSDRTLTTIEAPISFRGRRGGSSKVSGRLLPSIRAGMQILRTAVAETSPRARVVLMAKSPSRAKSRLAAGAGGDIAAGFWEASIIDTAAKLLQAASADRLEARVMVSAADDVSELKRLLGPAWIMDVQDRPGLNEALVSVFTTSFAARAPFAMAVSGDNPTLPSSMIHEAVGALRRRDAVLGPTPDGGYYLVGLKRSALAGRQGDRILHLLFDGHVTGASARDGTLRAMTEAGLSVAILEPWADVDDVADLRRLATVLLAAPETAPATAAWLARADEGIPVMRVIRSGMGGSDVQR